MVTSIAVGHSVAQDFDATATAIVVEVTLTADALTNAPDIFETPGATDDTFSLTATALIRSVTQTAEASTGNTAVPITAVPQSETFSLTATALVREATETAGGVDAAGQNDNDASNDQSVSVALIAFGALIVILVILGVVVVFLGRGQSKAGTRR